jgi:hypothetical protein
MATLVIRVYKNGESTPEKTVKIPGAVLKIASGLMPKQVSQALGDKGIDLSELHKLVDNPEVRGIIAEVEEHKKNEKTVVALE